MSCVASDNGRSVYHGRCKARVMDGVDVVCLLAVFAWLCQNALPRHACLDRQAAGFDSVRDDFPRLRSSVGGELVGSPAQRFFCC